MDEDVLERLYQERLEERIIAYLATDQNISLEQAMNIYYDSELAEKIHLGTEGIQYLDYRVLTQILKESELCDGMTKAQFNKFMENGLKQAKQDESFEVDKVFSEYDNN